MFGGNNGTNSFNDLWYFNGTEWTFQAGSQGAVNSTGSYGTMGTAALTNTPPSMDNPAMWVDSSGNLWLFGGYDSNNNVLNALWKWSP